MRNKIYENNAMYCLIIIVKMCLVIFYITIIIVLYILAYEKLCYTGKYKQIQFVQFLFQIQDLCTYVFKLL